jgi:hypothetical protein
MQTRSERREKTDCIIEQLRASPTTTQPTAANSTQQPNKRENTDGYYTLYPAAAAAAAALTLMSFSHFQNCRSLLFLTLLLDIETNAHSLDIYVQ